MPSGAPTTAGVAVTVTTTSLATVAVIVWKMVSSTVTEAVSIAWVTNAVLVSVTVTTTVVDGAGADIVLAVTPMQAQALAKRARDEHAVAYEGRPSVTASSRGFKVGEGGGMVTVIVSPTVTVSTTLDVSVSWTVSTSVVGTVIVSVA